jgi:hypothetical protein
MMRVLLAAMFWCVAATAFAQQIGDARVTLSLAEGGGVNAAFRLSRGVTEFRFAEADVVRAGDIDVLTPGLSLDGDVISSATPFRRFEVRVRPMSQERDAKYPAFYPVGEGGVLYAPTLRGDQAAWRTYFRFRLADGHVRLPTGDASERGSIFIGPRTYVTNTQHGAIVAAPDMPAWAVARASEDFAAALDLFTRRLGVALPARPMIVLAHGGDGAGMVADVTPGPSVGIRVYGASWQAENEFDESRLDDIIPHEAFHFWNGALVANNEDAPTWLHEGGADYAALLSNLETGAIDDARMRQRLGGALSQCRRSLEALGDPAIADIEFLHSGIRYPCGLVLQWATDLHMRGASGGERNVLNAWAETIALARGRESRTYDLADFYAAAGMAETAIAPIQLLVATRGSQRWPLLVDALRTLGADIEMQPNADTRRFALLFHILNQVCTPVDGESIGFTTNASSVQLDSYSQCGVLAGDPMLNAIEGADPFNVSAETYAAAQAKCAARRDLVLTINGSSVAVRCATPLADAPPAYLVTRWAPELR